jgi:hypothetical protein
MPTSENPLKAKFAELAFCPLEWIKPKMARLGDT